jgi:hypothetical protein
MRNVAMIDWLAHIFLYMKLNDITRDQFHASVDQQHYTWMAVDTWMLRSLSYWESRYTVDQFNLFLQIKNGWLVNDSVFFFQKTRKTDI